MKMLGNKVHKQTHIHLYIPVRIVPPMDEGVLPPQEEGTHILLIRRVGGRGRVDNVSRILNTFTYYTLNKVYIVYMSCM